jgi:hypothetical protein
VVLNQQVTLSVTTLVSLPRFVHGMINPKPPWN